MWSQGLLLSTLNTQTLRLWPQKRVTAAVNGRFRGWGRAARLSIKADGFHYFHLNRSKDTSGLEKGAVGLRVKGLYRHLPNPQHRQTVFNPAVSH